MINAIFSSLAICLLSATPAKKTPVPGSKILFTTYEIKPGSATETLVKNILKLETVVEGINKLPPAEAKKKDVEVKQIVSGMMDLNTLGSKALQTHWEELGKTAKGKKWREKYASTFKQLVEENYLEKARTYVNGKYEIPLVAEKVEGNFTTVTARIYKTDVDLFVDFKLAKTDAGYKIVDIKLDETSLEATYRSSFNRIIKKNGGLQKGFPELLSVMEKRLTELQKGRATTL